MIAGPQAFATAASFEEVLASVADFEPEAVAKLQGRYGIVRVSISSWDGDYQIANSEVVVDGISVTRGVSRPKYHLLPEDWKARISGVRRQAEEILAEYGEDCELRDADGSSEGLRGLRVVPADRLEECCRKLDALRQSYEAIAEDFASDAGLEELHKNLDTLYVNPHVRADAAKHLPNKEVLHSKFKLRRHILPAALPNWAVADSSFQAREMQKTERQMLAGNLDGMLRGPRKRVAVALRNLADQLTKSDGRPLAKRRVGVDSIKACLREVLSTLERGDCLDNELTIALEAARERLDGQLEEMEASKRGHSLNKDDDEATELSAFLRETATLAESDESLLEGLKKICATAGVEL